MSEKRQVPLSVTANNDLNTASQSMAKNVAEMASMKYPSCLPMLAVYGIVCGLKRHLGDKNGDETFNPLDALDKSTGN